MGHIDLHRFLAVKLDCQNDVIVCVNVYLPSFNKSVHYEEDILNCFAFIESIFSQHLGSNVKFMVIRNIKFDLETLMSCNRLSILKSSIDEYKLRICDDLDCNKLDYTYRQNDLNVELLIDNLFISDNIVGNISK